MCNKWRNQWRVREEVTAVGSGERVVYPSVHLLSLYTQVFLFFSFLFFPGLSFLLFSSFGKTKLKILFTQVQNKKAWLMFHNLHRWLTTILAHVQQLWNSFSLAGWDKGALALPGATPCLGIVPVHSRTGCLSGTCSSVCLVACGPTHDSCNVCPGSLPWCGSSGDLLYLSVFVIVGMLSLAHKEEKAQEASGARLSIGLWTAWGLQKRLEAHVLYHKILGTLHLHCRPENTRRDNI